ncbi:MAG TPA: glycosyltransferase family 9 protein [Fimbriimonadaceae bacterium]|nr:glycosyltransferase family 9 protein [Fimbriimonadaceae bacterium]
MKRSPRRILAVCREHIGDIVNTTPYLQALSAAYPDASLVVEVGEGTQSLLEGFPGIAEVWARPTHEGIPGKWRRIRRMRKGRFDLTVIFDDSQRFAVEAWLAGIRFRAGVYRKGPEWLWSVRANWSRERHDLFDPFDELLEKLEVPRGAFGPRLFQNAVQTEKAMSEIQSCGDPGKGLICLNPCSNRTYNQWREEGWAEVVRALAEQGYRPVLIGPPNHSEANQRIAEASGVQPANVTGKLGLLEAAEFIRVSKYLISVDTGTVHIGVAMGTPTVVLYGPTDPKRFYPWGDRWETVRGAENKMAAIEVSEVLGAFERLHSRFP